MSLISRLKTFVSNEILTAADLNAEFNNIVNNFNDDNIESSSSTVTQMRVTQDPGEVGSEVLAANVLEEIRQLRNIVREITGKAQWYETPTANIEGIVDGSGNVDVIADGIVTTSKIVDANVTEAKLANGAVTAAKLANGAVTAAKLANDSVDASKIAANSVGNSELQLQAVRNENVSDAAFIEQSKLAASNFTEDTIVSHNITSSTFVSTGLSAFMGASNFTNFLVMFTADSIEASTGFSGVLTFEIRFDVSGTVPRVFTYSMTAGTKFPVSITLLGITAIVGASATVEARRVSAFGTSTIVNGRLTLKEIR